jgi:hypothetical protein
VKYFFREDFHNEKRMQMRQPQAFGFINALNLHYSLMFQHKGCSANGHDL